jgi:hypothetical protein
MRVGDITVPPFVVSSNEFIGLAYPADYGPQWYELMELLSGARPTPQVRVLAKSCLVAPSGFGSADQARNKQSVGEVIASKGIGPAATKRIVDELGMQSSQPYRELQLTPRLLLDLALAWAAGAELVVFTTAGLDPSGTRNVASAVSKMLGRCSAIDILSTALMSVRSSLSGYSKTVVCTQGKDMVPGRNGRNRKRTMRSAEL